MRPFVWVRYDAFDAWTWSHRATPPAPCGPQLENATSATAYDVHISELALDEKTRYQFEAVDVLQPGEARPLESLIQAKPESLTKAISRHVVDRVLSGQSPAPCWPIRIAYRSRRGREYETRCEIRVLRMPLGISSIIVPADRASRVG
jgi:hypothetical protein